MRTLLLDRTRWDLITDAKGNLAVADNPYSIAQDVASAIKLYLGELWYQTDIGVPYYAEILGHNPPLSLFKARVIAAALTVPEVASAVCYIQSVTKRQIVGQVQVKTVAGAVVTVALPSIPNLPPTIFTLDTSTLGGPDVLG